MFLHDVEQAQSRTAGFLDTAFPIRHEVSGDVEIEGEYRLGNVLTDAQIPYLARL